jgi:ferredoxin--NADP+ reductase|tara:strand:+ start:767 stop:1510 length:744 start_codon:yes stop_codon:yes gene_type:complete
MITWLQGKVVKNKRWSAELFTIYIKTEPLEFKAGQFILIGVKDGSDILYRPYSLVNTPDENLLEVHFNTVKDGTLSPLLTDLSPGDSIQVSNRPTGLLTLEEVPHVNNLWFFATGTGVGPFISILKTAEPWQRFKKVVLCYAVKTLEDMAYIKELDKIQSKYKEQFCFIPFITREVVAGTVNSRLTTYLESGDLEKKTQLVLSAKTSHTMLCGNADMINDVTQLLEQKGLRRHSRSKPGQITIEKYY